MEEEMKEINKNPEIFGEVLNSTEYQTLTEDNKKSVIRAIVRGMQEDPEIFREVLNSTKYQTLTENNKKSVIRAIVRGMQEGKQVDLGRFSSNSIEDLKRHNADHPDEDFNAISKLQHNQIILANGKIVNHDFKVEKDLTPSQVKEVLRVDEGNEEGEIYDIYTYNLKD